MNVEKGKTYWFVVLRGGMNAGYPVPMMDGGPEAYDDEVALYESREEAEAAAEDNPIGRARGYEIYEWEA